MGKDKKEIPADVLADADQESGHSLWRLDPTFVEALKVVIERHHEVLHRLTDGPREEDLDP